MFVLVPAQAIVRAFLMTFVEYPPRQKPGSFSLDRVLETLQTGQPKLSRGHDILPAALEPGTSPRGAR